MADCIFCQNCGGVAIPAQKSVIEDDQVVAFDDINPQAQGSCVSHSQTACDVSLEDISRFRFPIHWDELMVVCLQKLLRERGLEANGFRVVVNTGQEAGRQYFTFTFMSWVDGRFTGLPDDVSW